MSKDIATLTDEAKYLEQLLDSYKVDHATMRLFLGELVSPEALGYAVTPEVRKRACEIMRRLKA